MSTVRLPFNGEHLPRVISVAVIAAIHILLLCFLVFDIDVTQIVPDPPVTVMKLVDIEEYTPPPPPPPTVAQSTQNTAETIAEKIVGVEDVNPSAEVSAPAEVAEAAETSAEPAAETDYLPQHQISVLPEFDLKELQRRTVYPPIAQRSGIEGSVVLELFIDREGYVRDVTVKKETPEGRGFAEAAIKAFQDFRARPAQANGEDVAVRYRWPVRFTLR